MCERKQPHHACMVLTHMPNGTEKTVVCSGDILSSFSHLLFQFPIYSSIVILLGFLSSLLPSYLSVGFFCSSEQ